MSMRFDSDVLRPATGLRYADISEAGGYIELGQTMAPMKQIWPAVDATNGPLTADSGIVAGSPSLTGRTLFTPGSNPAVLNTQSQYMQSMANGVGGNTSGQTVWLNASGPRLFTFGTRTGLPYESNIDFGFITEDLVVTVWYYHYNAYTSSNYHDMQMYVEQDGVMKKITRMPATSTGGGGLFYRTLTFKEAREREFRVMLPMNCWLVGVSIGNSYTIRKSPNKFLLIMNGDSWNEPGGGTLQSPIGGAYPTGTFRTAYLPNMIAEATGWAVALTAQGGTGYFNVNDGVSHPDTYTSGGVESTFLSVSRINDMYAKFFAKYPLVWTMGGWNDGNLGGTPYLNTYYTRVLAGIDRARAAAPAIQMLFSTIQPVATGSQYEQFRIDSTDGIIQACAERGQATSYGTVIGCVDMEKMWLDMSTSGQRGNNVGPDTIHLHAKGAEMVANWNIASIKNMRIPRSYYQGMLDAA